VAAVDGRDYAAINTPVSSAHRVFRYSIDNKLTVPLRYLRVTSGVTKLSCSNCTFSKVVPASAGTPDKYPQCKKKGTIVSG
jgi:hypothetical protein